MDIIIILLMVCTLIIVSVCTFIYTNQQERRASQIRFIDDAYSDMIHEILRCSSSDELTQMDYVLCIGYRGSPGFVHAIKLHDKVISTEWGRYPKWSLSKDKQYVSVNDVQIPIEYTRDVTGYCRLPFTNTTVVSPSEFKNYLLKLQSVIAQLQPMDKIMFKRNYYKIR